MMAIDNFTWAVLLSPSAYIFIASIAASVFMPIRMLMIIPILFDSRFLSKRRYINSLVIVISIIILSVFLQFIIWGSFLLPIDKDGYGHLRMIPFFPWPESPFVQWR